MSPMRRTVVVRLVRALAFAGAAAGALWAGEASASENAASVYLLGSGGPEVAIMPPLPGVFLDHMAYFYGGSSSGQKQLIFGGNVVVGVQGNIPATFTTLLWQPDARVLGATFAVGAIMPVGAPSVSANAVLSGPLGAQFAFGVTDDTIVVGDPLLTGMIGWKFGQRTYLQASTLINIPIGDYRQGKLANIAFHRWAGDLSLAATWHDNKSGWDVSGKAGVTFNDTNDLNDYTTGTESHYELSVEKTLSPAWSAGVQAYYFYQLTGDSGSGAKLGTFKGRVAGIGGNVTWRVKAGKIPLNVRIRGMHEFGAARRLEGDSLWLDLTMPLHVKLPPGAHP